jgi:transposase InsO family protein
MFDAFPFGTPLRFLHRYRNSIFNGLFRHTISTLGLEEIVSAPRSPWQNLFAERVIGSIRRGYRSGSVDRCANTVI